MTQEYWFYEVRPIVGYVVLFVFTLLMWMILHLLSLWVDRKYKHCEKCRKRYVFTVSNKGYNGYMYCSEKCDTDAWENIDRYVEDYRNSIMDCAYKDPLHYHHDGCPSCGCINGAVIT